MSIRADGSVFLGEREVAFSNLAPELRAAAGPDSKKPIYVRADGRATLVDGEYCPSGLLSVSGFEKRKSGGELLCAKTGAPTLTDAARPAAPVRTSRLVAASST